MYHDTYVIFKYIRTYTHIHHYEDLVPSSAVNFAVGVS